MRVELRISQTVANSQPLESRQLAYMTEPSKGEEKTMAYGTEIQEIMGRGYGDVGTPWRIAEERKSVGIGEFMRLNYQRDGSGGCLAGTIHPTCSLERKDRADDRN